MGLSVIQQKSFKWKKNSISSSFCWKNFWESKTDLQQKCLGKEPNSTNDKFNETSIGRVRTSETKDQSITKISNANSLENVESYSDKKSSRSDGNLDNTTEDSHKETVQYRIGQVVENNRTNDEPEKGRPERKRTVQVSETLSVNNQGEIYSAGLKDATRKESCIVRFTIVILLLVCQWKQDITCNNLHRNIFWAV